MKVGKVIIKTLEEIGVDTVFGGCYKRKVFDKVGLFNENIKRNSDIEFNRRLAHADGKIYLFPDIIATYYTATSFNKFLSKNFKTGFWNIYPIKFTKTLIVSARHLIPFNFLLTKTAINIGKITKSGTTPIKYIKEFFRVFQNNGSLNTFS